MTIPRPQARSKTLPRRMTEEDREARARALGPEHGFMATHRRSKEVVVILDLTIDDEVWFGTKPCTHAGEVFKWTRETFLARYRPTGVWMEPVPRHLWPAS